MKDFPCPVRDVSRRDLQLPDLSPVFLTPDPTAEITHPHTPGSSWGWAVICEFTDLRAILRKRWEMGGEVKKKKKSWNLEFYRKYRSCLGMPGQLEISWKKSRKQWKAQILKALKSRVSHSAFAL